nr:pyrimidine dimer DNA glycosylase/endonuclease V [Candidatus Sigynarchaeum springense]MDO8118573.1 pyrimidine dimer DNA glycosylase/endonuclease V [Candidatus Sigynarchaeota archaeon]
MPTFITGFDMEESARHLDSKRLGKQRVEALQILRANLSLSKGWKNHPVTKTWKGYEPFLLKVYLKAIMGEWERRGYKNVKCVIMRDEIAGMIGGAEPVRPEWLTERFILSHKSNLVRKKPEHYSALFPGLPDGIPYSWTRETRA